MTFSLRSALAGLALLLTAAARWGVAQDDVATTSPPAVLGFATGVAVDAAGNRYVCGAFDGTQDFNPGVGSDVKTAPGSTSTYITRFNADGNYAWTQIFGGSGDDEPAGLVVSNGTVYVCGMFSDNNSGIGAPGSVASAGSSDVFVIALDAANGAAVPGFGVGGVQRFGGSSFDTASNLTVSGTTLYVTGSFASVNASVGFGGPGTIAALGNSSAFILALNTTTGAAIGGFGNQSVQRFGGSGSEVGRGVVVVGSTVYCTGNFSSNNAGIGNFNTFGPTGATDVFIIALKTSDGSAETTFGSQGVQKFGGSINDQAFGIASDGTNLFVTGVHQFQQRRSRGGRHNRRAGQPYSLRTIVERRHRCRQRVIRDERRAALRRVDDGSRVRRAGVRRRGLLFRRAQ